MSRLFRLFAVALLCCSGIATAAQQQFRLPDYTRTTLPNGATVLLMPRHDVPMIAATVLVRGGALADPDGKEGTAELLSALLEKGAGKRDALAFAKAVDGAGGSLGFGSTSEAIFARASFLSKDADLMLSLLGDAMLHPTLAQAEFDKLKQHSLDAFASAKEGDPRGLIDSYLHAWLFQQHPYGRPSGGDETSLAAITLADLKAFRDAQMGGDRLIIAIAGDFDPQTIAPKVAATFGNWRKATGKLPHIPAATRQSGRRVLLVDKPGATQTYFTLANVGSDRNDPAKPAQDLVQTVFGGRFTSMINTALRIKSGLSYGANSEIERPRTPGAVSITSYTKTESTGQALDLAIATLDTLHRDGLDAAAIDSAKHYISGHFAPRLETAAQLANELAGMALYGDSRERIEGYLGQVAAATPAQVNAATGIFPTSADLVIVAIGDAAKIRDTMKRYGPLTEMQITQPRFSP